MIVVFCVLVVAGIYLSFYVAYWLVMLSIHFFFPARPSAKGRLLTRFAIIIPAHNEELFLPRLLSNIRDQDYPAERFDTIVVADNCTDATADAARHYGASVVERFDDDRRGKGYAIKWALETLNLDHHDAVLIVDADCFMSNDALASLDGELQEREVIQCYSGVGNPDDSWFTRLLDVSRTINNDIYSRAKQRLGLSCQLIGTGMCFAIRVLKEYGWDALTVGEDCEYYVKLTQNGEVVGFNWYAKIFHQESLSLKQATSQRMRWSSGRLAVAARYGFPLLARGVIERSVIKLDAGLTLIFPNPSLGMNATLLCLGGALLTTSSYGAIFVVWFLILASAQFGIFVTGVFYTKNRLRKFLAIFAAPAFLLWKMGIDALSMLGVGRRKWTRTERRL